MAAASDQPDYGLIISTPAFGQMVRLGDVIVPQRVQATLVGGGEIDGRKFPEINITFEVRDGASVCSDFRISSGPNDRPIRTPDIAFLDLDHLASICFYKYAATEEADSGFGFGLDNPSAEAPIRESIAKSYREPLSELRQVARVYCNPASRGKPASSVFMSLAYNSRETANRRIRSARDAGLIPPAGATNDELDAAWKKLEGNADEQTT